MPSQLYKDLMEGLLEVAELEGRPDVAQQIKNEMTSFNESLENDEFDEVRAKLKEKYDKTIDWYHRAMENQSLPGEYDRNNPIINENLIARASQKFGFASNKLRRALKGEDIWK